NRAIEIRMVLGDELGTADLYANSGAMYGLLGNYPLALKSHMQALKIFEQFEQPSRVASTCSNIGVVYAELKNYDEALKMYQRALDIRYVENDATEISDILNNIANVYHDAGKFNEALNMHERALELRKQTGNKTKIATSLVNLGDVYKALNQYPLSLDFYSRSIELFETLNEKRGLVPAYYNIGELYFLTGDYKNARYYLDEAIKLAEEIGLKDHLREAYEHMAMIFAEEGKFEEAYKLHVKFTELNKEVANLETSRLVAQMTMRHEIEQKDRETELERVKNLELTKAYNSLELEKQRSEELLLNILPEEVSEELKQSGKTRARSFEMVSVLFADIKGFTLISEQLSAEELVSGIDEYFEAFDKIVEKHGVEKIKTIGDAYLCAGGVPVAAIDHAERIVAVAKDFICAADELRVERAKKQLHTFDFRIGIHSGPVVAGVVGIKKFAYDIWGDTVNTASRMQQHSEPGRINISESTYQFINGKFNCAFRGEIEAKNKGKLKMYFVE
ncbi:MAG TPA: adenylate/guanylate cyclase domain-containing protein, partial [Chitinophagales bacterium]|nr:adenylate/guanylate cyclase domain-containing protein [Chitinophagales bacterium]